DRLRPGRARGLVDPRGLRLPRAPARPGLHHAVGPGHRGPAAYLTYLIEPAVRPPTTRPSMRANRRNTGMVATTEAPNRCCQSTGYWPMNESSRTVSG